MIATGPRGNRRRAPALSFEQSLELRVTFFVQKLENFLLGASSSVLPAASKAKQATDVTVSSCVKVSTLKRPGLLLVPQSGLASQRFVPRRLAAFCLGSTKLRTLQRGGERLG